MRAPRKLRGSLRNPGEMNEEKAVPTCCAPQETGGPDLEQQLVFHDPLHWFDEEVVELQAVPQLLPELLGTGTDGVVLQPGKPARTDDSVPLSPKYLSH